jgi:hypothetical protein
MPLLGEERSQSHRVDVVSLVSVRVRLVLRPIVSCAAFKTTFEILHGRIGSAADCSLGRHWTASDVQEWRSIRTQWLRTSRTPINIVVSDDKRRNVDMLDFPCTVFLDKLVPEDVKLPGSNAQVCITKHRNLDITSNGFLAIAGNHHNHIKDWMIVVDALRQTFRIHAFQELPNASLARVCCLVVYDTKTHVTETVAESRSPGNVPSDLVVKSAIKAIIELYGDPVPATCIPKFTSRASKRKAYDYREHGDFCDRFAPLHYARMRGATQKSEAQQDAERVQPFLNYFVCRYAVSKSRFDLLGSYYGDIPLEERFGMFKLAIDQNNLSVFKWLIGTPNLENETTVSTLAIVLEYTALRGRVEMMEMLHDCGLLIDGDGEHHPFSAAAAGGSLEAVKWLIEHGGDPYEEDRKSIVKEYAQTPVVIAAHHGYLHILQHLSSVGISLRAEDPDYDALHIALRDHRPSMLVGLLQNSVRFEASDPPMEKALEIAVGANNPELARLLLQAGADPSAKEDCIAFHYHSKGGFTTRYGEPTTFYGTLFQWACAKGCEDVVRAFLDHNVNFDRPVVSWANWHVNKPIFVAYSCRNMNFVRAMLEHYDDVEIVRMVGKSLGNRDVFLSRRLVEYEEVKN